MNSQAPQLLKGFRDFLPEEKRKRDYVASKIKETFELFGFDPLETPTLEYASLLLGKYGSEADKLVYQFKDRGDRDIALRYDQTVPTARVLAEYQSTLPKYFRRYQIQNVFRADKPQKGRYREFTQCDADIFGSQSPLADAEILAVYYAIYKQLGINSIRIQVNDRATLIQSLSPFQTEIVPVLSIIQSIDKLDKIPKEAVVEELTKKGLANKKAADALEAATQAKPSGSLTEILSASEALGIPKQSLQFQPSLARGLDYYTGLIFEGVIPEYTVGSVGGGGRYDNLIKQLSNVQIEAVGFGLGFDRTVEAADQLNLLPSETSSTKALVTMFDQNTQERSLAIAAQLRDAGIKSEVFPAIEKLEKQLKYADKKGIPFVVIIGPEEAKKGMATVKNMRERTEKKIPLDNLVEIMKKG